MLKIFFISLLLITSSTCVISTSKSNVNNEIAHCNNAPTLEKINESYFVNGEEVNDASTLISQRNNYYPKKLVATPTTNNWNMVTKSLLDGKIDFFAFDQDSYSYRQFAYDDAFKFNAQHPDLNYPISKDTLSYLEPKSIVNPDSSISLFTDGFKPIKDNLSSNINIASYASEIIDDDNRRKIANTDSFPYSAAGQIVTTYENIFNKKTNKYEKANYIATGFLEGPDLLVTAGHALYCDVTITSDGDDSKEDYTNNPRFPDSIYYFPARNGSIDPYGKIEVERIYLEDDYYLNTEKDWGCCKLSKKIGNQTGYLGKISNFYKDDYPLVSFGYPASKNGYMYETTGTMTQFEDNGWYYRTTLDTEGGQSGSPYRININGAYYVCGIHTYSVGNSYTGGIRIDGFMFSFMNSFVSGDLLYKISPDDYGFADAYPTDDFTATNFTTHTLTNGFTFRTRRYRTGYIQKEYIVMSPIRPEIPRKEAFIEYSFNVPVNKIKVELTYWRHPTSEIITNDNASAYLQIKNGEGWSNKFDILSTSNNLSTDRGAPSTYIISFDRPTYVFRFYSEYHGSTFVNKANRGRICIGDMTLWTKYDNYMPLNGSELEYEPSKWNNKKVGSYNCYAYSLNTKNYGFMQPGQSEGHNCLNTENYFTKSVILSMVNLDAKHYNFKFEPIDKYAQCDKGFYKVALVIAPGVDYHWYRQNYDGTWSHKPGGLSVTNIDNLGQIINDPETCNRNYYYANYSEFCGFYQVNIQEML